ncbi:hypothetical protein NDU88_011769 [Pleurodeles waltl]|uniref:Uncharacterized protein n=1 Tax=Pleurodeles waltl TaxID=8319 RepID=A0AAV7R3Z3_PLEWA|nr:hypothetical protein NDU88_011769 [Pleurodeles waltl]
MNQVPNAKVIDHHEQAHIQIYTGELVHACTRSNMADYEDDAGEGYCYGDHTGSFEQDSIYALDAEVCHTVSEALVNAIRPIKQSLLGFAEQQAGIPSTAPHGEKSPVPNDAHMSKGDMNPPAADFDSFVRSLAKDQDLLLYL